jgi:hypothetical protein
MTVLIGNGQPGRITLLGRAVERLQPRWWKLIGIATGESEVVSLIAWIVKH